MKLKELREKMETMYMIGNSLEYLDDSELKNESEAYLIIEKETFDRLQTLEEKNNG